MFSRQYYVKTMERINEKGADYAAKELTRLKSMAEGKIRSAPFLCPQPVGPTS